MKKGYAPWNKGKRLSEEIREKMRVSSKGRVPWDKGLTKETSESLRRMSEKKIGRVPWNRGVPAWSRGLTKETDDRLRKTSISLKGRPSWRKGLTKETDERIRKQSESCKGRVPWNKGLTKETDGRLKKISESHKGENGSGWIDGRSFLPYPVEFTRQLKELIRQRDNYQCQKCGCSEIENMRKLCVHHIDYDKENCLPSNLTALCDRCNSEVNSNRVFRKQYFSTKLRERGF